MAIHREGGSGIDDTPPTRWELLKKFAGENPLTIWPVFIILGVALSRFFVEDPLGNSLLSMVTVTAMGTQWLGIFQSRRKMSKKHQKFDEEHISEMIELNAMGAKVGMEPHVNFLSPYKPKGLRKLWYKLTNKRMLALYSMGEGRSTAFTKYIVDEKDWFFLKLSDYIDTTDPALLVKALEYLKDHKKVATIL